MTDITVQVGRTFRLPPVTVPVAWAAAKVAPVPAVLERYVLTVTIRGCRQCPSGPLDLHDADVPETVVIDQGAASDFLTQFIHSPARGSSAHTVQGAGLN